MPTLWEDLLRLLAAFIAGAALGFERDLHDKPAGLRTNLMICLGAALFTILSIRLGAAGSDPGRIAAQVVTGVGFLGAGSIIQRRDRIVGLTTAATIWLAAGIGMAFGSGHYVVGIFTTLLSLGALLGLGLVEDALERWRTTGKYQIDIDQSAELSRRIDEYVREFGLRRRSWRVSKHAHGYTGVLVAFGPRERLDALQRRLMAEPGVLSLVRL